MTPRHLLSSLVIAAFVLNALGLSTRAAPVQAAAHAAIGAVSRATPSGGGSPNVDGVIDAVYGAPIATDPVDPPQGFTNMDLGSLYVTNDADYLYVAFTINANIITTNWGKYLVYFDTTNNGSGAPNDAWGRSIVVTGTHKPEYSLNAWVDGGGGFDPSTTQFWAWSGAWSQTGTATAAARGVVTSTSVIEYKIARTALGNPTDIWLEVLSTGGGGSDPAQDTLNNPANDWNATNWSTPAVVLNSTPYTMQTVGGGGGLCADNAAQDNNILWADLSHDSRAAQFRTPFGAVPMGTTPTVRLRAAHNDLTAAKVRVYNDRTNISTLYAMTFVATDGVCDWWEATLPASPDPTIYWYRFIAQDGTASAYYEDDNNFLGGLGQTYGTSPDRGWQISMYDPTAHSPAWAKNAVIYQIFADRFRDGNPANNTISGTFFYSETGGTIARSLTTNWNQVVCDPRAVGACNGSYSKNFYGGDLQGLINKLDYLQDLGITAIYLNPVFESPSNHKYDTTAYGYIDDNFGDLATFITFTQAAETRGMHVILDGVFNHVSSDSPYLDRYGRYPEVGACESTTSPYRSWFYFTDVLTGTGSCVGSSGVPNGATYEAWFGYDSLPKLRATSTEVRNLIWADSALSPTASIARYWLANGADGWRLDVGGDVDPGTTNDPTNNYWEGFRLATRATYSDTYIVGEEWGNGSAWFVGNEWDATMNYQYSSAMLSFWRDTAFVDNDHNSGSSAGTLAPLSPSQLNERLLNWQERYPPETYYAQMNLLGSHDTSRALFMLDPNTGQNNPALYQDPNYDWSNAINRLKGVIILQMTLPGAPTIYYGDEVGLVGPVAWDGTQWQDDPYNRQPFPWLDESGTPFYAHLQSQPSQDALRNYYRALIHARNAHPALRTGSFDPLKVDDPNRVYVYGRKSANDAALVAVNRYTATQSISVNVSGYLPNGAVFTDVLNSGAAYTVTSGMITVTNVPQMSGAVLVLASGSLTPPAAPTLYLANELNAQVALTWTVSPSATAYHLYRSLVSGGGYTRIVTNTTALSYTDSALTNAASYYYVVEALNGTGLASPHSNEVLGVPHYTINTAQLSSPASLTHTIGLTATPPIYGQVIINGVTSQPGPTPTLWAQLGYGLSGTQPADWAGWTSATFYTDAFTSLITLGSNSDVFRAALTPEITGTFHYAYRFSTDNGRSWLYADLSGPISATALVNPGVMLVQASGDAIPPAAPLNLSVSNWSADYIALAWDTNSEPDLFAYDLYRSTVSNTLGTALARINAPGTAYTDTNVTSGATYYYSLKALDTSFNPSAVSNTVSQIAEFKQVQVVFQVGVPSYTPGTVYIAGSFPPPYAQWNPGALSMTQLSPTRWTITLTMLEGTELQYKYTRGDWDKVEAWGNIAGLANRALGISYGLTGTQFVDDTATDWGTGPDDHKAVQYWRDPLVATTAPVDGATDVSYLTTIQATWSVSMSLGTDFAVIGPTGAVSGTFGMNNSNFTLTFTPTAPLQGSTTYTVTASGETDLGGNGQQVPYTWSFTTETLFKVFLPMVRR